jgi:hypothetical protein
MDFGIEQDSRRHKSTPLLTYFDQLLKEGIRKYNFGNLPIKKLIDDFIDKNKEKFKFECLYDYDLKATKYHQWIFEKASKSSKAEQERIYSNLIHYDFF